MKKQLFTLALSILGLSAFSQASAIWQPYNSNIDTSYYVKFISVVDTNTVWGLVFAGTGDNNSSNHYTRTIDGANFHGGTFMADTNTFDPTGLAGVSANTAYVCLYDKSTEGTATSVRPGRVLMTNNGGASWSVASDTTTMFISNKNFADWIHFWDPNNGIVFGDPNGSTTGSDTARFEIWRTHNGGTSWTRVPDANIPIPEQPYATEYGVEGIYASYHNYLWAGTSVGRLLASADSGKTWTVHTTPLAEFSGIAFRDSLHGLAWGVLSTSSTTQNMYSTSDGGATWTTTVTITASIGLNAIAPIPHTKGYMSVGINSGNTGYVTSVTYNDGVAWTVLETGTSSAMRMLSLQMLDSLNGWAGCYSTNTLPYGTNGIDRFGLGHKTGCPITITTNSSSTPFNVCSAGSTTITASGLNTYTWSTSATTASITVTPSVTTSYSVAGTTTAGCANYEMFNITVITPTVTSASKNICAQYTASLIAVGATTYTWSPASSLSVNTGSMVVASPTLTTTYTITGSYLGCNATGTTTVTVKPSPNVTVTSSTGTTGICSGSTATLTASGASSYTWSPTGGNSSTATVAPGSTTIYTISGTGTVNTCVGKAEITVNIAPSPSMLIQATSHTLCPGSTDTLKAFNASTYTWSPAGSLSSPTGSTVTATPPVGVITYTIAGTGTNTCVGYSTITLTVVTSCVAGIEQISNNSNMSVYPNPSNGIITVSVSSVDAGSIIYVTDLIGQEIMKTPVKDVDTNLDLSALQKGVYMITITNPQYRHIEKVIIQ